MLLVLASRDTVLVDPVFGAIPFAVSLAVLVRVGGSEACILRLMSVLRVAFVQGFHPEITSSSGFKPSFVLRVTLLLSLELETAAVSVALLVAKAGGCHV